MYKVPENLTTNLNLDQRLTTALPGDELDTTVRTVSLGYREFVQPSGLTTLATEIAGEPISRVATSTAVIRLAGGECFTLADMRNDRSKHNADAVIVQQGVYSPQDSKGYKGVRRDEEPVTVGTAGTHPNRFELSRTAAEEEFSVQFVAGRLVVGSLNPGRPVEVMASFRDQDRFVDQNLTGYTRHSFR